jgi:hypothetical protein
MDALLLLIGLVTVLTLLSWRLYATGSDTSPDEGDPEWDRLALVIDPDLMDALEDRAKVEGRSVKKVLNDLIRNSFRDRRDSGPRPL